VGTLAYGIAHEFNNILAGILGNAEFGMGSGDSKEVEGCFRVIMENCDRAGSITNSLLTLARQRQAKKEVADLTGAVENVVGLVERELEKQNIKVERKFKPVPEIVCDLGELSEVFLNMITNARDAMKPDGGALTIEIRKRNHNIEIIFADTGGGIPDEIRGRIFEPFVTTKGALGQSEIPGTGLGLFLSIGIISRYHGKIELESQVGKGSKFTIKIPVTENQELPVDMEAEEEVPAVLPPDLKVLLVDDEETICDVVKKFLEEKGYSVVDTTSGKKGLKLFKDKSFDLVLSDITMPDMDGVKLISKLKSIDPAIKLVTLTGHVAEEKLEAARKAGADQILLKPFKKEDLYKAIGRALSV
jgi:CheY-like chemotaxis protein/anti-sigma regulatory factor (Ser/Thr protein kinase)